MDIDFKTLSKEKFEELCKRIMILAFPNVETVDGAGGDEGVDSYQGIFNGKIKIWQFKFFLDRLNSSRKKQIENSLKVATKKHNLTEWILCLPMEFSPAEIKWFQALKLKNKKVKINILNIHRLRKLIQKHRDIRDEFFRGEEKTQLTRMEKALNQIREEGKFLRGEFYADQISLFKLELLNVSVEQLKKMLVENYPFRGGLGFKRFTKISNEFYKSYFYIPKGNSILTFNFEGEDNPFKLSMPFSYPIEIWIKEYQIEGTTTPKTNITCFTSHDKSKMLILKAFKESIPREVILNEIDFNRKMKGLVSQNQKFAPSITTVELDPHLIEKVSGMVGKTIDVEIRSNIIHSRKGGLPKTKFMQKALSLVKSIRKGGKLSEIIFFRAKQTSRVIKNKIVTFEAHNDGRIRVWFGKKVGNKEKIKKILDEFIGILA